MPPHRCQLGLAKDWRWGSPRCPAGDALPLWAQDQVLQGTSLEVPRCQMDLYLSWMALQDQHLEGQHTIVAEGEIDFLSSL